MALPLIGYSSDEVRAAEKGMGPPQRKIRKVGCPKAKAAHLAAKRAAGDKALSLNADDSDDAGPVPDPNARGSTEVAHDAQPQADSSLAAARQQPGSSPDDQLAIHYDDYGMMTIHTDEYDSWHLPEAAQAAASAADNDDDEVIDCGFMSEQEFAEFQHAAMQQLAVEEDAAQASEDGEDRVTMREHWASKEEEQGLARRALANHTKRFCF